jgi:Zn finger protein HypA/HybF involved in hydrogenase expression
MKHKRDIEVFVEQLKLEPCPFCGSDKIKLSSKTTTIKFQTKSHVQFYCNNCHTYGPRVLTDRDYNLNYPYMVDKLSIIESANKWNTRAKN